MNKKKTIIAIAALAVLAAGMGGFAWWRAAAPANAATQEAKKPEPRKHPAKYVTLDKVIVMLRRGPNEEAHYLSTDLVLATDEEHERHTKEHLPLLRSIAVRTLSGYNLADASAMTVEQYAALLNKSFDASYAKDRQEKPFNEVMLGKLIIE
jgi:flagellar FliL protein